MNTGITEEQYLRTSFPGVDHEFRDGQVVTRGTPDNCHSEVQGNAGSYFVHLRRGAALPFYASISLRHRIRPRRYVVPDVAVHWPKPPSKPIPSSPPLIVIEVLSPDDRMSAVLAKLEEYLNWGVAHVWFVDPHTRVLSVYDGTGLHTVPEFQVPHTNRTLTVADLFD